MKRIFTIILNTKKPEGMQVKYQTLDAGEAWLFAGIFNADRMNSVKYEGEAFSGIRIAFILMLVSFCSYGQITTDSIRAINYQPTLSLTPSLGDCTVIAFHFNPTMIGPMGIKEAFLKSYKGTEFEFDCRLASMKFNDYHGCKFVEVRISVNGKSTDYTFAEFKKLIWPK